MPITRALERPASTLAPRRRRRLAALVALLVLAATPRLPLLLAEWPASNSDEATTGLMAIRIAQGRDAPVFMDGQSYMGTLQAYAAALVFRLSGPSLLGLRLPMLLAYLLFLVLLHVLARRLYGTAVALWSVALLALGSRELFGHQLVAQGAMPETLLAGAVLLLLGHRLLEAADDPAARGQLQRRRLAGWGVTASLGLWSTVLTAPFVATSGVLVALALRRTTAPAGGKRALAGGLAAGALPWLVHDLTHPWRDSGVVGALTAYRDGGTGLDGTSPGLVAQVTNTVTTSLAYVTGGSPLAHPSSPPAWPWGYEGSWRPPTDDPVTTLWGVGLVLLWLAAAASCVRLLRRPGIAGAVPTTPPTPATAWARTAMLSSAGLTVLAFAAGSTPGVAPANNARYLVGVLVATPAVLAPLWSLRAARPRLGAPLRVAVLALAATSLALGTVQALRDAGRGPAEGDRRAVLDVLRREGVAHVYSGYLDCNRLTFLSGERVTCAVLAGDAASGLRPGFDRYPPYRTAVQADPGAAFVFRVGDPRLAALDAAGCGWRERRQVAGYDIRLPAQRCPAITGATNAPVDAAGD